MLSCKLVLMQINTSGHGVACVHYELLFHIEEILFGEALIGEILFYHYFKICFLI